MTSSAITLRPARAEDLGFAAYVYLRAMGDILRRAVGLDAERQGALLLAHWNPDEIRIISAQGRDVGWIQTAPAARAVFIRNFCVDPDYQRLGIGGIVLQQIIDAAHASGDAVTLGVAKGNAAKRLYERVGFRLTHDDPQHHYLRLDPSPAPAPRSPHR